MQNNAQNLKYNSVKINGSPIPNGADFVSNSQMAYKWVQPEFTNN